jgi:hypothetical protein
MELERLLKAFRQLPPSERENFVKLMEYSARKRKQLNVVMN